MANETTTSQDQSSASIHFLSLEYYLSTGTSIDRTYLPPELHDLIILQNIARIKLFDTIAYKMLTNNKSFDSLLKHWGLDVSSDQYYFSSYANLNQLIEHLTYLNNLINKILSREINYKTLSQSDDFKNMAHLMILKNSLEIAKKAINNKTFQEIQSIVNKYNMDNNGNKMVGPFVGLFGIFIAITVISFIICVIFAAPLAVILGGSLGVFYLGITPLFLAIITPFIYKITTHIMGHIRKLEAILYHQNAEELFDAFQNKIEHILLECQSLSGFVTYETFLVSTKNDCFSLCKEDNTNNFKLYYRDKNGTLIEIPLTDEIKELLTTEIANNNLNNLSHSLKTKIQNILQLDINQEIIRQKVSDRDTLAKLFLSNTFENTNSTGIKNIRDALKKNPDMSSYKFFDLIETEIGKSFDQNGGQKILSYFFQENFKEKFRHTKIQELYNLIKNSNEKLKDSPKLRKDILDLINSPTFDLKPANTPSLLSPRLGFSSG
jgi:hypothetical protein